MIILFSFIAAYWFQRELQGFSRHVNIQIYNDLIQLQPSIINFEEFLQYSKIQPLTTPTKPQFFWLCPTISLCLLHTAIPLQCIALLLLYLSLLDYHYSLTDARYIGLIFWIALAHLLFYTPENLFENILNVFMTAAFFICFFWCTQFYYRQEVFGFGDVMLFIALAPLFNFTQMITLILLASLLGLSFAFTYFCKFKRKIDRLPFIPFISLSTFLLFIVKLPV